MTAPIFFPILNHMVQYSPQLDASFAALADPTRRGILERLGRGEASISELATDFGMTLTGIKKHVGVLTSSFPAPVVGAFCFAVVVMTVLPWCARGTPRAG